MSEELKAIDEKLEKVVDQNQKIAEGLLAIADLIKGREHEGEPEEKHLPDVNAGHSPFPQQAPPPPLPGQVPEPLFAPQPPPAPSFFPKPEAPSLNPAEGRGRTPLRDMNLPPLPAKPKKKGLFG